MERSLANFVPDFAGAAHLATEQRRMGLMQESGDREMQRIELQKRNLDQEDIRLQQSARSQDQEDAKRFLSMLDDPRVRGTQLEGAIMGHVGKLTGFPALQDAESLERGGDKLKHVMGAMVSGNRDEAMNGYIELLTVVSPNDAKKLVESVKDMQGISEFAENMEMKRKMDGARFDKLRADLDRVSDWQNPYTEAAQEASLIMKGTDDQRFSDIIERVEQIRGTQSEARVEKVALAMGGGKLDNFASKQMGAYAERASVQASNYSAQADYADSLLDTLAHGGELPQGTTRQQLLDRVAYGRELADGYSAIANWAQTPFDKTKLKAAKDAFRVIESKRKELDGVKERASNESVALRREAMTMKADKDALARADEHARAQAKRNYINDYGFNFNEDGIKKVATQEGIDPEVLTDWLKDANKGSGEASEYKKRLGLAEIEVARTGGRGLDEVALSGIAEQYDVLISDLKKVQKDPNAPLVKTETTIINKGETKFTEGFAGDEVKRINEQRTIAEKAPEMIERSRRIQDLLNSKDIITGKAADFRLQMAKTFNMLGWTSSDAAENTELLGNELAKNVLGAIKSSGLGSGNGFTEKDLQFLQQAVGADYRFEKKTLQNLARISENVNVAAIKAWNERVKTIPKSALDSVGLTRESLLKEIPKRVVSDPAPSGKNKSQGRPNPKAQTPIDRPIQAIQPFKDQSKESRYQQWLKQHPEFQ